MFPELPWKGLSCLIQSPLQVFSSYVGSLSEGPIPLPRRNRGLIGGRGIAVTLQMASRWVAEKDQADHWVT